MPTWGWQERRGGFEINLLKRLLPVRDVYGSCSHFTSYIMSHAHVWL